MGKITCPHSQLIEKKREELYISSSIVLPNTAPGSLYEHAKQNKRTAACSV